MAHVALRMLTTIRMRLKTIAKLLVVSLVLSAASPALATPMARHDVHCGFCEQKADAGRDRTFGPCISPKIDAPHWSGAAKTHDDWPANMILG